MREKVGRYYEIMTELENLLAETHQLGKVASFPAVDAELFEIQQRLNSFKILPRIEIDPNFEIQGTRFPENSDEDFPVIRETSITGVWSIRPQFVQVVPCL